MNKFIIILCICIFSVSIDVEYARASEVKEFLMGAVVKSDKWKVDRKNNTENFKGHVSFVNPDYEVKADKAVYWHNHKRWNVDGNVYSKRNLEKNSKVEMWCEKAIFLDGNETGELTGNKPVIMKYTSPDGTLDGKTDKVQADNNIGQMLFTGNFFLTTGNINLYSSQGTFLRETNNFFLHDTKPETAGFPLVVGNREGYNFSLRAETMNFYKNTRDLKCKGHVTGWVKDIPYLKEINPAGGQK